jgi:hypothetical protein
MVVLLLLLFLGPWLGSQIVHEASSLLDEFPIETR